MNLTYCFDLKLGVWLRCVLAVNVFCLAVAANNTESSTPLVPRPAPVSLHLARIKSSDYTCEDFLASLLKEFKSHAPSLAYFSTFISALGSPVGADADKTAAAALAQVDPLDNHDLWLGLFYGCRLRGSDTVIQRIYRLGLIECARALKQKGIYSVAHYLHNHAPNGDNLMHLAVRSGNPELVNILGDTLHEHSITLLRGPLAVNAEGYTPQTLAKSLKRFGPLSAVQNLFSAYSLHSVPPCPAKPIDPDMPSMQFATRDRLPKKVDVSPFEPSAEAHHMPSRVQPDLTHVRLAAAMKTPHCGALERMMVILLVTYLIAFYR